MSSSQRFAVFSLSSCFISFVSDAFSVLLIADAVPTLLYM